MEIKIKLVTNIIIIRPVLFGFIINQIDIKIFNKINIISIITGTPRLIPVCI